MVLIVAFLLSLKQGIVLAQGMIEGSYCGIFATLIMASLVIVKHVLTLILTMIASNTLRLMQVQQIALICVSLE